MLFERAAAYNGPRRRGQFVLLIAPRPCGNSLRRKCIQPVISGAHFFATIPVLPYKMGLEDPCECIYALGYYRPGNCAPKLIYPIPLSLRGALYEAGAISGLVFLLP